VPEASVHEHCLAAAWEDHVGAPRQVAPVHAVAVADRVQHASTGISGLVSWPQIAAIRRRPGSGTSLRIERGTFIRGDKPSAVFGSVCAGPRVVISSRPEAIRGDGAPSRRAANGSMRRADLEPARRSAPLPAQLRSRVASQCLVHIQEHGVDPPARAARAFRSAIAAPGTPSARAAGAPRSASRARGFIGQKRFPHRRRPMRGIGRRSASLSSCSRSRPSFGCSTQKARAFDSVPIGDTGTSPLGGLPAYKAAREGAEAVGKRAFPMRPVGPESALD
jgi:hypothetical protein